jgi:hypothetical protein
MHRTRRTATAITLGVVALLMGLIVYWTQRDPQHAWLVPTFAPPVGGFGFGVLGQWLPSFVHPLAFSVFTAALLPPRAAYAYGACVAWAVVNVAFEVGQHPALSARVADALHAVFGTWAPAQRVANYLTRGTFDVGDIVAAVLGATAAALLLRERRPQ